MATNGLLVEVRWEWMGTELLTDEALGSNSLGVVNASALALDQVIWVGTTGPYTITAIDYDNDIITTDLTLPSAQDLGTEVVPDVGGEPGQIWIAEVILQDADDPIEVPLTVSNLTYMAEGIYDPPVVVILSDDLERVIDIPGTTPTISTDYIPGVPAPDDGKIPAAPTLVNVSQALYLDPGGQNFVLATVTWDDPIENTDTSVLTDLHHIELQRKIASGSWQPIGDIDPAVETAAGGILPQDTTVQYRVRAVDGHGNASAWATSSVVTVTKDSTTPGIPSTPTVTAPLSTLKVVWDGLLSGGGALPVDYLLTEVHVSTSTGFTPTTGTQVATMRGKDTFLLNGLTPGTTYYVKLINVDQTGNKSGASAQASATPVQIVNTEIQDAAITAAKIQDSAVTTPKINPEAVTTEKLTVAGFTENLLANGGQEELQQADVTKPARWALNQIAATATFATDTANELSGDRCTSLVLSSATAAGRIYNTRPIPVKPGDVYYVAMAVKNSRTAPNTNILEAWTNIDSTNVLNPSHGSTTITTGIAAETGHTGYTVREGTITVPAGKTWMTIAIRANATGDGSGQTMYVDDVVVRKLIGDALIVNLTASKITAGTLQADVLLSSKFYTDVSPNARVEIDGLGLRAYDDTNKKTIDISGLDGQGSFVDIDISGESNFGTTDPITGEGSAQITPDGDASFQSLFASAIYVGGDSITDLLNSLSKGAVARSTKTLSANKTATGAGAEVDLYEISAECVTGRIYRFNVDPVLCGMNAGTESGGFKVYYTTDGSRPTNASPSLGIQAVRAAADADNQDVSIFFSKTFKATSTSTHRFLLSLVHTAPGASDYIRINSGREIRITVEDVGAEPPDTGINPGDSAALTSTFKFNFTWTGYFQESNGAQLNNGKQRISGSTSGSTEYALMGFTDTGTAMRAALAGYTINWVRLYLIGDFGVENSPIAHQLSKAHLNVYEHNLSNTSTPSPGPVAPGFTSPIAGGQYYWPITNSLTYKTMPNSLGDHLRDNTCKGIRIGVPDMSSWGAPWSTYAEFWGAGHATKYPYLYINATKY